MEGKTKAEAFETCADCKTESKCMAEGKCMGEASEEVVKEGTWHLPDTPKLMADFKKLMSKPIKLGRNGDDAIEALGAVVGDDELFDDLYVAGKKNATGDARDVVKKHMKRLGIKEEVELDEEKLAGWIAMFNGKQVEIYKDKDAKDLYSAKLFAIKALNVPKSKQGLLSVEPAYEEVIKEADLSEAVDAKKVVAHLVKKGSNPKDAEAMVKKEFDGAIKAYPNAPVAKIADYIMTVAEAKDGGYTVKHKTFSSAIQHAVEVAMKRGYEVDADDYDRKVAMGPKKPSEGKTNSYSLKLMKDGKEQRKALQVQIANLDNKFYELNMYIQ